MARGEERAAAGEINPGPGQIGTGDGIFGHGGFKCQPGIGIVDLRDDLATWSPTSTGRATSLPGMRNPRAAS